MEIEEPLDSIESQHSTAFDFQTVATQTRGAATSLQPSTPCQLPISPDNLVLGEDSRTNNAIWMPRPSQPHSEHIVDAQQSRTIDAVTIHPDKIRHYFSVYVSSFVFR